MILIEIQGHIFNPLHIIDIYYVNVSHTTIVNLTNREVLEFKDTTPKELAAEINDALYDHEYFLELKRLDARRNTQ